MYQSEYFKERETKKRNAVTSTALTVGIIITAIELLIYFANICSAVV